MSEQVVNQSISGDASVSEHELLLEFLYRMPTGILECTFSGEIRMMNAEAARILQEVNPPSNPLNVLGTICSRAPDVRQALDHSIAGSDVCRDRRIILERPGQMLPLHVNVTIVRIEEDTLLITLHDATHVVGAEQISRESFLATALKNNRAEIADGVLRELKSAMDLDKEQSEQSVDTPVWTEVNRMVNSSQWATAPQYDQVRIVVDMVTRIAGELRQAKTLDQSQKKELEAQKKELEAQKKELEAQKIELEKRVQELEISRIEAARLLSAVRELTAPVLAVHKGVILIPIAGALDPELLSQAEERVLSGVIAARARTVILDITGAKVIPVTVAEGLVRIACAVALLGARVVLCGVSAAAARTAVEQGLDFAPAILRSDLSSAVDTALTDERKPLDRPRKK